MSEAYPSKAYILNLDAYVIYYCPFCGEENAVRMYKDEANKPCFMCGHDLHVSISPKVEVF